MNWSTLFCFCRRASFLIGGCPTSHTRCSKIAESIPEGFSRKRCESAPKQLQFTVWLKSMTPGQWQFPITCWAVGSGGFRSWVTSHLITPALGTWLPEGRLDKYLRWSILTCHHSVSTPLKHPSSCTCTPQTLLHQENYFIHTVARDKILYTLHESPNHSAGGLLQETHVKPWCAFLLGGLVGSEGHWPYWGSWGWLLCSPGEKLPGLCAELEKILQKLI